MAVAEPGTGGQKECARLEWCTGYRLVAGDGGAAERKPGLTYQAFCQPDTAVIASHLSPDRGLPAAWSRLEADLGDPARRAATVRVPFGPRMVLSEYYDLLMRRIAEVLCSYEERVRTAARLVPLDTRASATRALRHGDAVVTDAARLLSAHLSVLLALPVAPVVRHIPSAELRAITSPRPASPLHARWADATVCSVAYGTAVVIPVMDGAGAGIEILDLHRRCLSALGEIAAQPELLDGIPCRNCEVMGLERATPPADPGRPTAYSRCPRCADEMDLATYREWAEWYARWAESAGPLTCQRCLNGDCDQCAYPACLCAAQEHAAA